jgi:xylan 1,4-beta-xylosidase
VLAVWNYAPPGAAGSPKTMTLRFQGISAHHASISRVDGGHGDAHALYEKMGSPRYPTEAQIAALRQAAQLQASESRALRNGELTLTLPSYGLAVVTLK